MNIPYEAILGSVASIAALVKSFKTVREGELGSKTIFGRAVRKRDGFIKVVKPGFFVMIPFVTSIQKAHITMDSVELTDLNVTMGNGLSYVYSAYVAYHVSESPEGLERFLYQVEFPKELITQKLSSSLRELLANEWDNKTLSLHEINNRLALSLSEYLLEKVGVILESCGLTSLTESNQSQQVSTAIAKYEYAKTIYGIVPESIAAACFGAMPISVPNIPREKPAKKENEDIGFVNELSDLIK